MSVTSIANTELTPYLADLESMIEDYLDENGKVYIAPARKELGVLCIPIVREIIAPATFRQEEPEPLTAVVQGESYVRAGANKFKYAERSRGLQTLRTLRIGGLLPQNRSLIPRGVSAGDYLDLTSFLFGDSANTAGRVLSATAAAKYSCALSTEPEALCVDSTFHNRANEWGTLYDAVNKKNSDNLFDRIFVQPGTLMVQILTFTGKVAPAEIIDFALACLAEPIASGGQTAITGVNVRTHVAGVYGGRFEKAINSPYILLPAVLEALDNEENGSPRSVKDVLKVMHSLFIGEYEKGVSAEQVNAIQAHQQEQIIAGEHMGFSQAQDAVSRYYTAFFDGK